MEDLSPEKFSDLNIHFHGQQEKAFLKMEDR